MTSRLSLYQNSIKKFINNQSIISTHIHKDKIFELIKDADYITPIVLLTIMNGLQKKNKLKSVHGYEMASGIELLCVLHKIFNSCDKQCLPSIITLINTSLKICIEKIMQIDDKVNKNIPHCYEQLNHKMAQLLSNALVKIPPPVTNKIKKTDLNKYHFTKQSSFEKLKDIHIIPKEYFNQYIINHSILISQITLILGWLLGNGIADMIPNLERLGHHFGMITKLSYDFSHIDDDIENVNNGISDNYVINYGIQEAFDTFIESKTKFIEGCLTLDISSATIKEIIDYLESKVENTINNTSPEIKLTSSPTPDSLLLRMAK